MVKYCVRVHLRLGAYNIWVLMELQQIYWKGAQGDRSLLSACVEMRRKLASHSMQV